MAIFAHVVEAQLFRGGTAARPVEVDVSKEVTKLEHNLGARVLNRTTRRLSLTEISS